MLNKLLAVLTFAALFYSHAAAEENAGTKTAIFAGGCFWCMQPPFDKAPGVVKTVVGYCGGEEANPTYQQVSAKKTSHRESVEVTYDPTVISYQQLLDIFWRHINPTQGDGQFADIGLPYHAAIFYSNDEEKKLAEESKAKLAASGKFEKPVVTEIIPAKKFWPAEEYHQKYYQKNAAEYKAYYIGSGRAVFLEKTWGDVSH